MDKYSVALKVDNTNPGFREGEYFGEDNLSREEAMSLAAGYLMYNGNVRIWKGMTLLVEYTTTHNVRSK